MMISVRREEEEEDLSRRKMERRKENRLRGIQSENCLIRGGR